MRTVTSIAAVAAVLTLTGMMIGDAQAERLKGTFAGNSTGLCNYTTTSGEAIASNNQRSEISGTYHFDGVGGFTIEGLINGFNVPAGTLSTSIFTANGTYNVDADSVVTTDSVVDATTIAGSGTGNTTHIPSIKGRFLKVRDELFRMSDGPPAEETVITTTPAGTPTTTFRKCSRIGPLRKIP